jgi:putative ABC transport system permease protein
MRKVRAWLLRLWGLSNREIHDRQFAEEIETHLQMHIEDNLRSGMAPEQARREAILKLGGVEMTKQAYRERNTLPLVETLLQDLRYALRQLYNHPGFAVAALLTLALGVAINTTIFSAVSAVLLRKPPVHDPDRVMMIGSTSRAEASNEDPELISAPDFTALRENSRSFAEMAAASGSQSFNLTGAGTPEHVAGMSTSVNYFHLLGVAPTIGRAFLPEDGRRATSQVAIISSAFWKTHFASDPRILGTIVKLNDQPYTIVGVMPDSFKLLTFPASVWVPLLFPADQLAESARASRSLYVFARLKPGVAEDTAQAEISDIATNLERSHPDTNKGWGANLLPLQEFEILEAHVRAALTVLMGVVGFVLLLACANIAGLLLGRGAARQQEFAIRTALGANRTRLFRQLFSESLLIAALGAGLGLLFSLGGIRLLHAALNINDYTQSWELRIDHRVLLFTLTLTFATTILFGLLPALKFSRTGPNADLKEAGRGGGAGRSRSWSWKGLVSGEIALALILLTAAGLMVKNFVEEMSLYPGFDATHLLTASIDLSSSKYSGGDKQIAFFDAAVQRVQSLPGAESATVAGSLPLAASAGKVPVTFEGQALLAKTDSGKRPVEATSYVVAPNYWQTMQIPIIQGRLLLNSDTAHTPPVAVVNQTFAERFFPKGDAIGRRISMDASDRKQPTWLQIVGVVGDVKDWFGQTPNSPQVYRSFRQYPQAGMTLVLRTRMEPAEAASAVRSAMMSLDKDQALTRVVTMSKLVDETGAGGDRLMGQLLGIFAVLALFLAAVGIYGIVAFMVSRRTHEIGIRLALGANRRDVLRLILGDGLKLGVVGLALGSPVAVLLPRLFGSVFNGFHVNASSIFMGAPAVLTIMAIAATYIPANRATQLDPMVALRQE